MNERPLADYIRDVPDFPQPGILFRDVTPLLRDPAALRRAIEQMAAWAAPRDPDVVVGIESRGFLFGIPLALELGLGFVPVRKPGKLPRETLSETYELEYGRDRLEMHRDGLEPGSRALIVDDLLATGGTAAATARLVARAGAIPAGALFLVELGYLGGRRQLDGLDVHALIRYGFHAPGCPDPLPRR